MATFSVNPQQGPATQHSWSSTPQRGPWTAPTIEPQPALNTRPTRPNGVSFGPILTPQSSSSQLAQKAPIPQQPSAERSRSSRQNALSEDEQTLVLKWCIERQDLYRDKNIRKSDFWADCSAFIDEEFNKSNTTPNRTIRNSVQKRRQQVDAEYKARGRAVADTVLKKALDEWIQVLDDIELLEGSERPSEQAKINEYKAAMERSRHMLTTRVSKRRTDWNDPSTEAESHRSSSRQTVVSQPTRPSSTSTPAQAQSTPPRKRRRTEDPYTEQLERLVDVIDEIRTGFRDQRLRDDRADRRWYQGIKEDLRRINRNIEGMRADMHKVKDLLQKTFADRLVQK